MLAMYLTKDSPQALKRLVNQAVSARLKSCPYDILGETETLPNQRQPIRLALGAVQRGIHRIYRRLLPGSGGRHLAALSYPQR